MNHLTAADGALPSGHPRSEARIWAARITECWRSTTEAIIRTGRLLNEAKGAVGHGGWGDVLSGLPFGERHAQMLMAIASDIRLSNPQRIALLPPSWPTIYDLSRLADDDLERGFREQIIRPDMERNDIELIRPARVAPPPRIAQPMSDAEVLAGTGELPGLRASQERAEADPVREAGLHGGSPVSMPSGGLAIAHHRVEEADSLDFFPTPPWATRALFEHVFKHLERIAHCKYQTAWEPACGEGHIAEVMREYFLSVHASDIHDYGYGEDRETDFLEKETWGNDDWIITNPPFNNSAEFVLKALKLAGTGVAMFVRLAWLESVGRYEKIFRDHPPTQLAIFSERVPLHKGRWEEGGTTMTAYIWLVWIKGAEPRAPFWIPPGCRESLTKPEDVKRFGKSIIEIPREDASGTAREAPSTGCGTSDESQNVGPKAARPHIFDSATRALCEASRARTAYPAGHTVAMTNPIVDGHMITRGTCACGETFSCPWGDYARMDAAIEAHRQKFDHLPEKTDGRGNPITQGEAA